MNQARVDPYDHEFELLIEPRLDAIDRRLTAIERALATALERCQQGAGAGPPPPVYQVPYRDNVHAGGQPMKTVLIARELPPLPCTSVPILGRILGVLEAQTSVRQRQGESMADDLIAILKRPEAE